MTAPRLNGRISTKSPVTRVAAWQLKPALGPVKRGCWCRAWCGPFWRGVLRRIFWPLPSPRRLLEKCASACTSGCMTFPLQVTKPFSRSCTSVAWLSQPPSCNCKLYAACTRRYCNPADLCRCALFIAGLPLCCAALHWAYCMRWVYPRRINCWKTTKKPQHWCGGVFRHV